MKRLNDPQIKVLDMLSTQELERILNLELNKDPVDELLVYEILCILKERQFPQDNMDPQTSAADDKIVQEKPMSFHSRMIRLVAVAAVLCLLITAVPAAMGAENIVALVGRWTKDVFTMIWSDDPSDLNSDYVFKTDHPGLQQLYDAVVDAGITQAVIPMWVPEDCMLEEIMTWDTPDGIRVQAKLSSENHSLLIIIKPYTKEPAFDFPKDNLDAVTFEANGIKHYCVPNDGKWTVVWAEDGACGHVVTTFEQTVVNKMIRSIYAQGG